MENTSARRLLDRYSVEQIEYRIKQYEVMELEALFAANSTEEEELELERRKDFWNWILTQKLANQSEI